MDRNQLEKKIGNELLDFKKLYDLVSEVNENIAGDWSSIFNQPKSYDRFVNYVRNLKQRGIIRQTLKSKKKIYFGKDHVLQILLVRIYQSNGVQNEAVKHHIKTMEMPTFFNFICSPDPPPDCEKLKQSYLNTIMPKSERDIETNIGTKYVHINAGKGIVLQIQDGLYDDAEIVKMVKYLKKRSH